MSKLTKNQKLAAEKIEAGKAYSLKAVSYTHLRAHERDRKHTLSKKLLNW